ncbi:rRNA accumulation- protein [Basidiobolus ranarum]|uniref:rRNA accumulation- protein n=1 Tax=Basidiobolus ranarum TaxID=34480 RepID=A0ABR2VV12_9FUNG
MPHPNQVAFTEGVTLLFENWTALKLAVEMEWGGVDSVAKQEWLVSTIVDYFGQNGRNVYAEDIEEILFQIMNDEFNTTLEDDSAYQIGKQVCDLYTECIHGNHTTVQRLRDAKATRRNIPASAQAQAQGDDSSSEEEDTNMES